MTTSLLNEENATGGMQRLNNNPRNLILLSLTFILSFIYRVSLVFWQTFPSGADIGFHETVLDSITKIGNTNLLYNFYQMGGGYKLEFPGYHIFVSYVVAFTGLPDYVALALAACLFSSLIVCIAFLITRRIWNETAALIAAFFVVISRFDIEILLWGGYSNVVALFLIPLAFYLFLQKTRFSAAPFLVSASFVISAIFLTHSLSAGIFVCVTFCIVFAMLLFPKAFGESRRNALYWLLPILGGTALSLPLLLSAVSVYLNNISVFTFDSEISRSILALRLVPLESMIGLLVCAFLALLACILPFFVATKRFGRGTIPLPMFLLFVWVLVPLVFVQGYLFGFFLDYSRFIYFSILPILVLFALIIEHSSAFLVKSVAVIRNTLSKLMMAKEKANLFASRLTAPFTSGRIYIVMVSSLLIVAVLFLPIFVMPEQGVALSSAYQVMNSQGYEAIQWVTQNTPSGSVFASDALYGWWLGGFAQRPTLSAVPAYNLMVWNELAPAQCASNLLSADYVIDNGYVKVCEDGGFLSRYNPIIQADVNWENQPYPSIQLNNDQIIVVYTNGDSVQSMSVSQLPVANMQLVGAKTDNPSIIINRADGNITYSEILTVSRGSRFANITIAVQSENKAVSLNSINFLVSSEGLYQPIGKAIAMFDASNNACSQIVFAGNQPRVSLVNSPYPCLIELAYDLQGKSAVEIQLITGVYAVSPGASYPISFDNASSSIFPSVQTVSVSLPVETFDYRQAILEYHISYVANRDFAVNGKFSRDPEFSLVFVNNAVAIFKVRANFTLLGTR